MTRVLRFDAGSLQKPRKTSQGYLRVDGWASRVGIQEYRNPDGSVRRELREDNAVFDMDSLLGFEGAPITDDHPSAMVDINNAKHLTKGTVLSVGRRDGDHVAVSLVITDPGLIKKMESGKRQLSTGYYVELDETPGNHPQFGRYDAKQVRVGPVNHIAVVERGRAGTASVRMDSALVDIRMDEEQVPDDLVARLDAIAKRMDEWDESSHPRAENGQFGEGGGGGGESKESGGGGAKIKVMPGGSEHRSAPSGARPYAGGDHMAEAAERSGDVRNLSEDDHWADKDHEENIDYVAKHIAAGKEPTGKDFEEIVKKHGLDKANNIADRVKQALGKGGRATGAGPTGYEKKPTKEQKAAHSKDQRERAKEENAKDRERSKRRAQGRSPALRGDGSAQDLHAANVVPDSVGMNLDAALERIKELEEKLDALFEAAPAAPAEKCKTCPPDATECKCPPAESDKPAFLKKDEAEFARLEGERDAARQAADEAKAAVQVVTESHTTELAKVRKDADESVTVKVREALDVLSKAIMVMGKDVKIKLDGKDVDLLDAPLRAVKCAVIKHLKGKTITAEKLDAYVDALFDDAVETFSPGTKSLIAAKAVVEDNGRKDAAQDPTPVLNPEAKAAADLKTSISSAWMTAKTES